jgi:copper chaperone CopZ
MLKLHIPDMSCGGCESKVRKALAPLSGIDSVEVDRGARLIQVNGSAPETGIIQAIEAVGFSVNRIAA